MWSLTTLLAIYAASTSAAKLTISIAPSQHLINPSTLPSSTQAQLTANGIVLHSLLRADNVFSFTNVSSGSYLLDIFCRDYFFEPLRVDVTPSSSGIQGAEKVQAWQTFRGNEWDNKGEEKANHEGEGVASLAVTVLGPKNYYQQREGFSVLSFLKSPMILMALFSMAMIFGMPKLLENMDPESRAEFEEMQKSSPLTGAATGATSQITNFDFAGWMAGKSTGSGPEAQAPPQEKTQSTGSKGGQSSQKRRA